VAWLLDDSDGGEASISAPASYAPAWAIVIPRPQQLFDVREGRGQVRTRSTPMSAHSSLFIRKELVSGHTMGHRPVRAARWAHPAVRRSGPPRADPAGQGDPSNPMAAMGADKSSHFNTPAGRLGCELRSEGSRGPTARPAPCPSRCTRASRRSSISAFSGSTRPPSMRATS